jgi:hypothetical protein
MNNKHRRKAKKMNERKQISNNTVAIFSDYTFFSDKHKNLGRIPSALTKEAVSISLSLSQRTAHPSVVYNKLAVENVGGYSIEDFPAEDLSLWLRLSRVGSLVSVEKNLLNYRLDANSVSFQRRKEILIKKHEILEKIGVNYADYSFACNNLLEILKSYDGTELANQRKLLLVREIFTLKNNPNRFGIGSKKIESLNNKAIFEILNFQTARDLYKLNSDRKKRNKIRELA